MNKLPDQPQRVDNSHTPHTDNRADSSGRNVKRYIFPFVVVLSVLIFLALLAAYNVLKPTTCNINGETHQAGDSFPAEDGCNTCSCSENGEVSCTLIACIPDDSVRNGIDNSYADTAWQQIKNDEFGYTIQIPLILSQTVVATPEEENTSGWGNAILSGREVYKVNYLDEEGASSWPRWFQIAVLENPDKLSLTEWITNTYKPAASDFVEDLGIKSVNGQDIQQLSIFRFDSFDILSLFQNGGYIYVLTYTDSEANDPEYEKNSEMYNQILPTFRFLDEDQSRNTD